jgi:hypothetical protein
MRPAIRRAIALALVAAIALSLVPSSTSAIPYKIEGYLRDSEGRPITLANISVTGQVYDLGIPGYVNLTNYAQTDANGYYRIWVGAMEPGAYEQGGVLTVSYNGEEGRASSVLTVSGLGAWANLTYEDSGSILDTLASPLGIVTITVIAASVAAAYFILRRTQAEGDDRAGAGDEGPKRTERRRRSR